MTGSADFLQADIEMVSTDSPRVSVVMAAYNVAPYVEAAVNSILQQTYTDFELLIIDDGSTDGTWEVLERLAAQDERIRLARNPENMGIAATRNRGTEMARGELLAVMDSDDWCPSDRFEKQVAYLDQHPEVGVVGGQVEFFFEKENRFSPVEPFPLTVHLCAWHLHFVPPVMHAAVMLRRALLVNAGGYRGEYTPVEECELWQRIKHSTQFANIPDIVLFYRRHDTNITHNSERLRQMAATAAQRSIVATLETDVPLNEVMQMMRYLRAEPHQVGCVSRRLYKLAMRFGQSTPMPVEEWRQVRRDAASRILWLTSRQTPWSKHGASAFYYALKLDPVRALQWVLSTLRKWATYRFGLRLRQEASS
ncbi:MAG: glycosyltransferase family 2 protein [Caldilineaceae bacterium]|nr:glycosyltransferase family 2 protein [Caldilineaceae bacterium]